jgi:carotenoid cleavage dioxygenase-like enzyme
MKVRFFILLSLVAVGFMVFSFFNQQQKDISAELQNEVVDQRLKVSGKIPTWLQGTLVRNGPIQVSVNGEKSVHWFDGLAMLHAFSFDKSEVSYSNRFLRTNAYQTVFEKGSLDYAGFASDPCRSIFKQFLTYLLPRGETIPNANVNVAKIADQYVALTETPLPVRFNPHTLETLGVLNYQDELPKEQCWESAHPHYDVKSNQTWNYLIQFGRYSLYTLYHIDDHSSQRKILADIPVQQPSYMHSFAITQNYVIFTEFPIVVKPLDLITSGQPFIKNFHWKQDLGTQFIVVDRQNGNVIGKYKTKPFFSFHHANAFEQYGRIHIDIVTYANADILTDESLHVDADADNNPSQLERFSLDLVTGEITSQVLFEKSHEFPRISEAYDGLSYTYLYAAGFKGKHKGKEADTESLYKVNTGTKEVLTWFEEGCSPGEPLFVPAPGALAEDDGVVLTVVIDRAHNGSFLLVLDAKTFKEIGRAQAPHLIPPGFHGQYYRQ